MQKPLFMGVDGGGSTCRVRIADALGRQCVEAVGGPANTRLGLDDVFAEIIRLCRRALVQAGLDDNAMSEMHVGLGLAGLALASEREKVLSYAHPFASIAAENDAYTACLGAHNGEDGAILIVGTGTCGCGIVSGRVIGVGGWGFAVSDQGSGASIGRKALRRALCAHEDMVEASPLSRALMAHFDNQPERLVLWADCAKPADYAAFAPTVFEYAAQQDCLAQAVLRDAAEALNLMIRVLRAKGAPRIALLGGLAEPIKSWLDEELRAVLVLPKADALQGAIMLARRNQGMGMGMGIGIGIGIGMV